MQDAWIYILIFAGCAWVVYHDVKEGNYMRGYLDREKEYYDQMDRERARKLATKE